MPADRRSACSRQPHPRQCWRGLKGLRAIVREEVALPNATATPSGGSTLVTLWSPPEAAKPCTPYGRCRLVKPLAKNFSGRRLRSPYRAVTCKRYAAGDGLHHCQNACIHQNGTAPARVAASSPAPTDVGPLNAASLGNETGTKCRLERKRQGSFAAHNCKNFCKNLKRKKWSSLCRCGSSGFIQVTPAPPSNQKGPCHEHGPFSFQRQGFS